MKTTEEMIEVMQAYVDGKTVECCTINTGDDWCAIHYPSWDWSCCDYRVKPEPHYVPYDSVLEVERDKWIRKKNSRKSIFKITIIDFDDNAVCVNGGFWKTMKKLFEEFEYEDGSPCGKLVEE